MKKLESFLKSNKNSLPLFLGTLLVYALSGNGKGAYYNYYVLLSQAFLRGDLYVSQHPAWLNELVLFGGHYFVVYPPMPAILLMPFVFIFGSSFSQPLLSAILGALSVTASYFVIKKLFKRKTAFFMTALYAFGTMEWFHASVGSAWYIGQIAGMLFIWLSLLELLTKKRLFFVGFFIGLAYTSRLPTILALVFVLLYSFEDFIILNKNRIRLNLKNCFLFGLGFLPALLFEAIYNFLRFGVFYDAGYFLLYRAAEFNEPWYKFGYFSIRYIPVHLNEIFTALPKFIPTPPYVIPSIFVMALWFVTPAFLIIPFADYKKRLAVTSLVTVLIMSLPGLLHGGNDFTQFGYRNSLDYLPFMLFLVASAFEKEKLQKIGIVLILLSIIVNLWGVVMINFLNIWVI